MSPTLAGGFFTNEPPGKLGIFFFFFKKTNDMFKEIKRERVNEKMLHLRILCEEP